MKTALLILLVLSAYAIAQAANPPPSFTASWSPSPGTNVITNYTVFWGTSTNWTATNSVGTNLTVTLTNGFVRGQTYYFSGNATDTNGLTSTNTLPVTCVSPTPPAAQTLLRIIAQ